MPDSEDPKQVSSNDLCNSQFGGGLINADTVNAGRIGGDIYNIHLGEQTAASGSPAPSQNQRERSQNERDSLEKVYTLQSQKVAQIRTALVIETDVSRKFQYEQQLQSEERTLKELGDKLDAIEQQLQAADNSAMGAAHKDMSIERKPPGNKTVNSPLAIELEYPDGYVPLNSPFYIKQDSLESTCYDTILKPRAISF
ncbi:MAG: hypothetical protein V7K92_09810 [Nostoc sp.]|uniref:hypothetical protein n=1 Tax=Nostoc sp. TaxID=1180 RepID=UPI002FEF7D18